MVSCLVLLDSFASSGMTPQAVRKASRPMDTLGFFAKVPDQSIVDRLGVQAAVFSYPMTILAGSRSRRSKDEIAMGIQHVAFRGLDPGLSPDSLISRHSRHDWNRSADATQRYHSRAKKYHEDQSNPWGAQVMQAHVHNRLCTAPPEGCSCSGTPSHALPH